MAPATLLPSVLGVDPAGVTVVLFSQPDCSFCEEADYLKPPDASRPRHVRVAEGLTTGARQLVNGPDDADSEADSEADLARRQHVSVAPPIVGLSRDYFGANFESRIATALQAAARRDS